MKREKVWLTILVTIILIINGCGGSSSGGSSGSASSFSTEGNAPVIDNITTTVVTAGFEQNISSVVTEENGEYKIYVNENQKTGFKIKAIDKNEVTYSISEGDWQDFDVDADAGNFAFKKFTDFETKKEYHFLIIASDSVGNKTRKRATIYVQDEKNEKALPKVVNKNSSLITDNESKYFITTWKTDNNSTLNPKQITIPTFGDGYYYSVDWGDGTSSESIIEDVTHTYKKAGTYQVKISGKFPRIYFSKGVNYYGLPTSENNFKLISIDQWGDIEWSSMAQAFIGCVNLKGQALDTPNLSKVKEMYSMFFNAKAFNQDIGKWDVSNITDMYAMFNGAKAFNQNIGSWNVSNVTDMSFMFNEAKAFNQNIGGWDVSNVTNMYAMFDGAKAFNQNIGSWNVSNVTDMSFMFNEAKAFNQNIGGWDVSNVTNMYAMFDGAKAFNQNIGSWDVSNVTNMSFMFNKAIVFNQDIGNWNVSKVISMDSLFSDATVFNQDITRWDVSSVQNMRWMFYGANSFNQYIGGWDVSNVTDMNSMFIQAIAFNQNISGWNVSKVINMRRMFKFAISFNQNLENWEPIDDELFQSFDGTEFYNKEDMFYGAISMRHLPSWFVDLKRTEINHDFPLSITDEKKYFISTWKTDGDEIISDTTQITIPTVLLNGKKDFYIYDYSVDWGDGTSTTNITRDITHTYKKAGTYKVKITEVFPRIHFAKDFYMDALEDNNMKILSIDQWGDNPWVSMSGAFTGCSKLKVKATDKPNLSNVTNMSAMFYSASLVNDNIKNWNVSNVTSMGWMFREAWAFNQDINDWDISNVTNMRAMFQNTKAFNQNIENWNVSNVTDMMNMFDGAITFNQNIVNWDVSNVTDMFGMFDNAIAFNQNIGNWDVSSVIDMEWMFSDATSFDQNIGKWNISSLKYMRYMFQDATSFNQNLENWDVSNVKQVENANGDNVSAMLGIFDRTPLDKLPSWYDDDINYNNKENLNFKKINSFSKKLYLNNKNYKSKFGSFKKYQKLKYH